jgi:desulfoferrodoxin (superoxide reductase-like protein)
VPMETGHEVRWIELVYASSVAREYTTWGVLKLLYK